MPDLERIAKKQKEEDDKKRKDEERKANSYGAIDYRDLFAAVIVDGREVP